jgi:hypothetical protein
MCASRQAATTGGAMISISRAAIADVDVFLGVMGLRNYSGRIFNILERE